MKLILLCGGQSKRMGKNKAFLSFGEGTLLEYQAKRFSGDFEVYLSVPENHMEYRDFGYPMIPDIIRDKGPMGGIYSAFKALEEDILFFASVDAPFTGVSLAKKLFSLQRGAGDDIYATIPVEKGRKQPLFGAYGRAIINPLMDRINRGSYRMMDLVAQNTACVPVQNDPWQFFNMNDEASYNEALKHLESVKK